MTSSLAVLLSLVSCSSTSLGPAETEIADIQVTPEALTVSGGRLAQFSVRAFDKDSNYIPGAPITFESSDASVAVVDGDGTVWAFDGGEVVVTARPGRGPNGKIPPGQAKKAASVMVSEPVSDRPGRVTDLAVEDVASGVVTLSFTEVDNGRGSPADYIVRFQIAPLAWGNAADVLFGSCSTPVQGREIQSRRTCTVSGLRGGNRYEFQLVAVRGSLGGDLEYGELSNIVGATVGDAPWLIEDWSSYASFDEFAEVTKDGRWRTDGMHLEQMSFDTTNPAPGMERSLRYDFPDRTSQVADATSGRCGGYSIGRDLYFPERRSEIWVEAWVRFSPNFHTKAPESWGCKSNPDLKLIFGTVYPDGIGRYWVNTGVFGWKWETGDVHDGIGDLFVDGSITSQEYWDGEWHRLRMHWRTGSSGNGAIELWIDEARVISEAGFGNSAEEFWGLRLGANTNQGPSEPISYWWGKITVWDTNPNW